MLKGGGRAGSTKSSAVLFSTLTHSILGAMFPKENFRKASLARKEGRLASSNGCRGEEGMVGGME